MSTIDSIRLSGVTYQLGGGDLSQYMTSAQTMSAITEATSGKQDTMSAGTSINITDNVISLVADNALSKTSTNPVVNSAITDAVIVEGTQGSVDGYLAKKVTITKNFTYDENVYMFRTYKGGTYECYIENFQLILTNSSGGTQTYTNPEQTFSDDKVDFVVDSKYYFSATTKDDWYITKITFKETENTNGINWEYKWNRNGYPEMDAATAIHDYIYPELSGKTSSAQVQTMIDEAISGKQDTLSAGTNITIEGNVISATGGGGNPTVELTQTQYDALVTAGTVSADTYYIITDAQAGDLTNYYTKTETNTLLGGKADTTAVTQSITEATSGKVDSNVYTAYTASTDTAIQGKQDTLVSGTNIKTINNESILGSGNITIQGGGGGGKAIEAGRGISITTGETADTVSFDLPIYKTVSGTDYSLVLNTYSEPSANEFKTKYNTYINCINPYVDNNSGTKNLIMGEACSAMSYAAQSFVGGFHTKIGDMRTFAFGAYSEALAVGAVAFGYDGQAFKPQVSKGHGSFACGGGTSANTQYSFATGYHTFTTRRSEFASGQYNNSVSATTTFGDSGNTLFSVGNGTADNARHNAFEIRQNGDIYCSDGTNDVKLQDTITATAANTTALGGLNLVKLTQAQYDALATKDNSTLYVIVN